MSRRKVKSPAGGQGSSGQATTKPTDPTATSSDDKQPLVAVLASAMDAARAMSPRRFQLYKTFSHPEICYGAHGDSLGTLVLIRRDYKPMGCIEGHADYAASEYDHLRMEDTPALRALAAAINDNGRFNFPSGPRVPILFFLVNEDSRGSYCARLRAIIELVRS